jgi:hypothetical protein
MIQGGEATLQGSEATLQGGEATLQATIQGGEATRVIGFQQWVVNLLTKAELNRSKHVL